MLISIWYTVHCIFWTIFVGLPLIFGFIILFPFINKIYLQHGLCYFGSVFMKLMMWSSQTKIEIYGLEHIEKGKHYIFAANHTSYFDIAIMHTILPYNNSPICKHTLSYIPIFGWLLQWSGAIFIHRKNTLKSIDNLNRTVENIKRNKRSIILFPEGTRSYDDNLQPLKIGGFIFAIQTKMPILPVAIIDCQKIYGRNYNLFQTLHTNIPVKIFIGKAINTELYSINHKQLLADAVYDAIKDLQTCSQYDGESKYKSYSFLSCFIPNFA